MLSVYFGSDRKAVRDRANAAFTSGVTVTTIDAQSFVPGFIIEAASSSSLFGDTQYYLLDTPSSDDVFQTEVQAVLDDMAEASHQFVIMESTLLAAQKKKYAKVTDQLEEFSAISAERFNTFALADALAQKDKKTLWVLLQEAKVAGLREEEIIGVLWWQLKTLKLADRTQTAGEAGVKDFPYNKAKRALAKFAPGEIDTLSRQLLGAYHDAHKGLKDLAFSLEKWVLSV